MNTDYTLAYGTHATPEDGRCAMEWVSHLAGEPHSDQPKCVSPALRAICIALNDGLDHEPRQRLRPLLTRTIGTADDGLDAARSWMAMDWLIREYTPTWLERAAPAPARRRAALAARRARRVGARQGAGAARARSAARPRGTHRGPLSALDRGAQCRA